MVFVINVVFIVLIFTNILNFQTVIMCFILGNNDHVRCFYCGIGLQNWDSEDNPFVEHARWSSECQYLKDKKGSDFFGTVQDAVRRVQMVNFTQGLIEI